MSRAFTIAKALSSSDIAGTLDENGISASGGGVDSAATNDLIDTAIINTNVADLVGNDGGYGQLLASLGNGNTQWTDVKLTNFTVPSNERTGTTGNISFDDNYLYVCTSPDNWIRIAYTDSAW